MVLAPRSSNSQFAGSYSGDDMHYTVDDYDLTEPREPELPLYYDPKAISDYFSRRPATVVKRYYECLTPLFAFSAKLLVDWRAGKWDSNEYKRASELRELLTRLGPAFIKLGQALSIRPDIVGPFYMEELQKLCDAVPTFPNEVAYRIMEEDLGRPVSDVYVDMSPKPIAAASLGQVYKAKLRSTGAQVAVKVQRPRVLEQVSLDLCLMRQVATTVSSLPFVHTDFVSVLDEWAYRFFDELDYVKEGQNAARFAKLHSSIPRVYIPKHFDEYTTRRVLTLEWLDGIKLSEAPPAQIKDLVNVGVQCFLMQLLETGFFHADPHPGNLMVTPDGKLALLDFGLMSEMKTYQMYGMIEAITHLVNGEYDSVADDFVALDFLPAGVDIAPVIPALTTLFETALGGGGVANINFQELSGELAEITFKFPFRIPPYFALILRALSVLEGIALVGDPQFKLVLEAYPYIARRLVTDDSPQLRNALRQVLFKDDRFDFSKFRSLLEAAEGMVEGLDLIELTPETRAQNIRDAIQFLLTPEGSYLRDMLVHEMSQGIDAYSREQLEQQLALMGAFLPKEVRASILDAAGGRITTFDEKLHARNFREFVAYVQENTQNLRPEEVDTAFLRIVPELIPATQRLSALVATRVTGKASSRFLQTVFQWADDRLSQS
eukprot:CAMPEP_0184337648 /NCGR_PEP_ID=MMETSP1089-20130417/6059_1 /TAXON_ID=38269 ORGANISM="Gloeochaete wittrockiana, Strain SAG46.84" /NCGR_SAMPLE_ID=MMETSP1089 /ASSEMBLY_ACC=CAM_ASM_000445 /LENGTH=662 /DNA_ID=CAMNT_0026663545 /DNA_START=293 /DNA_END=2281 /DNA_ORIENTATION=-